jgi:hypothetical protein
VFGGCRGGILFRTIRNSAGVTQVNSLISQMNIVTQQIASNAGESANGAEELAEQAEELKNMAFAFRISDAHSSSISSETPSIAVWPAQPISNNLKNDAADKNRQHGIAADAAEMIRFGDAEPLDIAGR